MSKSEIPVHPGKILNKEFLTPRSFTIQQFSNQTGISSKHVNDIINGKRAISKNTASILAKHLNTSPDYWLDLQTAYDIYIARKLLKGIIPEDDALEKVMVNNPHDKIIKLVFSDRSEAVEFFQKNMPPDLVEKIDWDTLELEGSKYVDEELKDSESDLLYSVNFKDSKDKCFLYLLFEHQSKPDKWLRFRIIKYKTRIWDESFKKYKDQKVLIPILSMVFYIGATDWNYSPEFSDLICESHIDSKYIPKFKHFLWDYSNKSIEFKGAIKAKIAHLLIQSHFHGMFKDAYHILLDYFSQLRPTQGINYTKVFFIYLAATQRPKAIKKFLELLRNQKQYEGDKDMITILDELRLEGKLETQIEIIENMLNAHLNWDTIQQVTGVDIQQFEDIKLQLQAIKMPPEIADQAMSNNTSQMSAYSEV